MVSEAGSAYTWCENAHELRLTPWHNDPVCDSGGEAIYLRDETSGQVWLPTALPGNEHGHGHGAPSPYVTRHGFGYSVFEHDEAGIHSELTVYVAMDEAIKFSVLRLRNDGTRERRLSATGYVEWVLGDLRAKTAPHITTDIASDNGALYARNAYSNDFGDWVGFFDVDEADRLFGTITCDRAEFIGRNGSLQRPAALSRARLSGRTGAALDPCSAIQVPFDLLPGQTREVVFRLGMGRSTDEAGQLVRRFRGGAAAREALDAVHRHWEHTLGKVQVRTPDAALNLLANGWLVYQTLACRLWARSGYYQSGGAFGFRDQLQDAMALVHSRPHLLREHLLLCASRQFVEGDVQHWWHPPSGRGVRTRISDDYLWLPLALCRYVHATHDTGVLIESVPFIDGRPVNPGDDSYFDLPGHSIHSASLYQHAVRALLLGVALRRTRPAADGRRRLERRHEPGRPRGPRRERVARLLPVRGVAPVRHAGTRPWRRALCAALRRRAHQAARATRGARMGRCLVSPRLLRRRHAARLGGQRGVPDRLDRTELVGAVGRGRRPSGRAMRWTRWQPTWCAPSTAWCNCSTRRSTATVPTRATSAAMYRACARTAASTPTARSGRRWPSPRSATTSARGS